MGWAKTLVSSFRRCLWGLFSLGSSWGGEDTHYLQGDAGSDTLRLQGGYDYMMGGAGSDRFLFDQTAFKQDAIFDFTHLVDKLVIHQAVFANFATLQAHLTQVNADTFISTGFGDVIVLVNFTAATLTAADVQFF